MRRFFLAIPMALIVAPALAQEAPQPSQRALIYVLHQQLQQAEDSLTLAQAQIYDLEQQLSAAKAAEVKLAPIPKPKGH